MGKSRPLRLRLGTAAAHGFGKIPGNDFHRIPQARRPTGDFNDSMNMGTVAGLLGSNRAGQFSLEPRSMPFAEYFHCDIHNLAADAHLAAEYTKQ